MTRHLAAALAVIALLAAPFTARASVLSDNLSALSFSSETATGDHWLAASFGTDATYYTLTSVVLRMALVAGSGSPAQIDIYTSTGTGIGQPGVLLGSLTGPASLPTSTSDVTFTASGTVLSPSTTYWVVLKAQGLGTILNWSWTPDDTGAGVGFQHTWGFSPDAGGTWSTFDTAPLQMQVNAEAIMPWTDLGFALAGVAGPPQLVGTGPLVEGTPGSLDLSSAAPSALALLFVSTSSTPTPFKGGTLVTVPIDLLLGVSTDGSGAVSLAWAAWPDGLSGLSLYFQYAIQDAAAVKGVALSNALRADVP